MNTLRSATLRPSILVSVRLTLITIMLTVFAGCASTETQEGTGEYIDDTVITAKVKAGIFNESSLKSREINIETFKGIVQLSGFVSSQTEVDRAGAVAAKVAGVKSVKNDIGIK